MAKTTMSTVDRAFSFLRYFSVHAPEIGLSELARMAGHDKTTTLRSLTALERNGFVEQDSITKKYRLGLAPINLARIRERSFPIEAILKPHIQKLARDTGETAHATLVAGTVLVTAFTYEPERATRVFLDPSAPLPVHATASGLAIAAHLPNPQSELLLGTAPFESFTEQTPPNREEIAALLHTIRASGHARADQFYEADVIGTAVPFFSPSGLPVGAIAVAAVASRFDDNLSQRIITALTSAGHDITKELGGRRPESL